MNDAKRATLPAELERQICSATVPKNEREWWAHREIVRLQESNRLRAELLAAARAELDTLRTALAEADEPVAWYYEREGESAISFAPARDPDKPWRPLYTHPPRREPLTEEQIRECWRIACDEIGGAGMGPLNLARLVEAKHRIGGGE